MVGGGVTANGDPNMAKAYPGRVTRHVTMACISAASGGLMFGYDIGISGGVTSMPAFLNKFFPDVYRKEELDHSVNQYCKFDSETLTMFTSSLYLAALLASFFASGVTRKFGRKSSIVSSAVIFFVGALFNALAVKLWMLIVGRILLGFGVGFSTQSVPMYLSEMAPYKRRGLFNSLFQFSITIGILIANLVNFVTANMKNGQGWRYSLGGAGVIALIIGISAIFNPETPNSLIERGDYEEARRKLQQIRGEDLDVQAEYNDLVAASRASQEVKHPWRNLLTTRKYRPQLILSILIPFFQQLTGINVVMFYAPVLFKTIGFGSNASLFSSVVTGGFNVLATVVAIFAVDKWGRRALFLEGGIQMFIFQIAVAALIGNKFGMSGVVTDLPRWYACIVVTCIVFFVAGFAWSWGPLGWLVPSEILPLEIRSSGQSIVVSVNMLFTFLIAQIFLMMLCAFKYWLFVFFACFVAIMTLFVYFFVPETKNIPIEEVSQVWEKHWYWKRFVDHQAVETELAVQKTKESAVEAELDSQKRKESA